MEVKKDPFYTSTKKLFGVIFLVAVLVGGGYAIHTEPKSIMEVLDLWAKIGGVLLGIHTIGRVSHSVANNKAK